MAVVLETLAEDNRFMVVNSANRTRHEMKILRGLGMYICIKGKGRKNTTAKFPKKCC